MRKLAPVIAACLILSACATTANKPAAIQEAPTPAAKSTTQAGSGLTQAEVDARQLNDQVQHLKSQSVYFDLDSTKIKPEYAGIVDAQAQFVKSHPQDIVTLAGNTDERGSSEYNLALGQRRAATVARQLELIGVPASQIRSISYGEEKPRLTCHEEKCWKVNRRVDFDHKLNS